MTNSVIYKEQNSFLKRVIKKSMMNLKTITFFITFIFLEFSSKAQEVLINYELIDSYNQTELLVLRESLDIPEFFISVDYEVDVYKLSYKTPDPQGITTLATGAVCIPRNMDCALPLCSYQHGTIASKMNVPSYKSGELDIGILLACSGYVLALPDYLGLGDSSGLHPYVHAKSEGTACLDMLRAVRELRLKVDFRLNDQLMLLGYSQGGHATMALHKEIEENAADEFKVDISIPMSGPYDISGAQTEYLIQDVPYATPGYLPYTILAYQSVYGDLYDDISEVLKPPYNKTIPLLFDGTYSMAYINSQCTAVPNQMLQDSTLQNFKSDPNHKLRKALADNDLYTWLPKAPVHMLYCDGDDQVSYLNSVVALDAFQSNGLTNVFAQNLGMGDHADCVTPALFRCKTLMDETRKLNLGIELSSNISNEEGSIQIDIVGGYPPFDFVWSSGDQTKDVNNLSPGFYAVTISDQYDCTEVYNFEIEDVNSIHESLKKGTLKISPNPSLGQASILNPTINQKVDVEIFDIHGHKVYQRQSLEKHIPLPKMKNPGIYFVQVRGKSIHFALWICL